MADLLDEQFEVVIWSSSEDGPLDESVLDENLSLLIWDSGDYLDEEGAFGEDSNLIIDFIDDTSTPLWIIGTTPTIFGAFAVSAVSDVEVSGSDDILLEGLTIGDIFQLDQTYDVITSDFFGEELGESDEVFLIRGPESQDAGDFVGLATIADTTTGQRAVFMFVPVVALPEDVQATLVQNVVTWLQEAP